MLLRPFGPCTRSAHLAGSAGGTSHVRQRAVIVGEIGGETLVLKPHEHQRGHITMKSEPAGSGTRFVLDPSTMGTLAGSTIVVSRPRRAAKASDLVRSMETVADTISRFP